MSVCESLIKINQPKWQNRKSTADHGKEESTKPTWSFAAALVHQPIFADYLSVPRFQQLC